MKPILIILIIFACLASWFVFDIYHDTGEFRILKPHFNGEIKHVRGIVGAEDITINPQTGVAYISSDDRRNWFIGEEPGPSGNIYAYDLASENSSPVNLTQNVDFDFHPHGISLFISPDGKQTLFVVNHRPGGHFIEIFDILDGELIHRQSVSGELLSSPNDVVAVSHDRFYATIDHGNTSQLGRTLEDYLRLERAFVVYYDGSEFKTVADGLLYANGINKSPDQSLIYVTATTGRTLHIYRRDFDTGELVIESELDCKTGVDNIELDAEGNLWIGAHPKLLTFVKHAGDASKIAPSEVIKISRNKNGGYEIDEIYLNIGEELSASSVAAVLNNKLLIGSVFDDGFLVCTLPVNK